MIVQRKQDTDEAEKGEQIGINKETNRRKKGQEQ